MNLHQIRLISALHAEFNNLFSDLCKPSASLTSIKIVTPQMNIKNSLHRSKEGNESEIDLTFDFETASMNSTNIVSCSNF